MQVSGGSHARKDSIQKIHLILDTSWSLKHHWGDPVIHFTSPRPSPGEALSSALTMNYWGLAGQECLETLKQPLRPNKWNCFGKFHNNSLLFFSKEERLERALSSIVKKPTKLYLIINFFMMYTWYYTC